MNNCEPAATLDEKSNALGKHLADRQTSSMEGFVNPPVRWMKAEQELGGTVLGFDFGTRRIGVAVGETSLRTAHPLTTISEANSARRFEAVAALVTQWHPVRLVVGVPKSMNGEEHELTARALRFARQLEGRFRLPVSLVDERLSTHSAKLALDDAGVGARQQKQVRDQVAAQIVLQNFLDGDGIL